MGYQISILSDSAGPLQQDLIQVGIEAQVCQAIERLVDWNVWNATVQKEVDLHNFISTECGISKARFLICFGDHWGRSIAQHQKLRDNNRWRSQLLWFFFLEDQCVQASTTDVIHKALAEADHVIFLTNEERSKWSDHGHQPRSEFWTFREFVDVTLT